MESILLFLTGLIGTGIGFWVTIFALVVLLSIFSEEEGMWATVVFGAGILFLQFIAKWDIVGFFRGHSLWTLVGYALAYVGIGLVWAVLKWTSYAHSQRRRYDKLKKAFLKARGCLGDVVPSSHKESWARYLEGQARGNQGFRHYSSGVATSVIPDVTENKAAIIRWMTYWLPSLAYTLLNDPVRRTFEFLYEQVGVKLQAVANHAFKGTEKDFLTSEEREIAEAQRRR